MVSLENIISPKKRFYSFFILLIFIPNIVFSKLIIGNEQSTIYEKPFWEKKSYKLNHTNFPKVSVRSIKQPIDHRLIMNGVVNIKVPSGYFWKELQNLENFQKASSHITSIKHDQGQKFAVMQFSAYGYYTRESMRVSYTEDEKYYYINFLVKLGFFKGANAQMKLLKKTQRNTDVSVQVIYNYKQWPVPKLFLEFGIEVVLQKMASTVKTFLQDKYKKERNDG